MSTRRLVLVTGATGYVGGRFLPALLARGEHVRSEVFERIGGETGWYYDNTLWRLLYRYALLPLHRLVFARMLDGVARRAEAAR